MNLNFNLSLCGSADVLFPNLVNYSTEKVIVVKHGVNDGGGNGAGCFEVAVWKHAAK